MDDENCLNRSQETGDIYAFRSVVGLLSFAATEVEAWYQGRTQYQHAATVFAASARLR